MWLANSDINGVHKKGKSCYEQQQQVKSLLCQLPPLVIFFIPPSDVNNQSLDQSEEVVTKPRAENQTAITWLD